MKIKYQQYVIMAIMAKRESGGDKSAACGERMKWRGGMAKCSSKNGMK
jgi:hypothetical protein